MIIMTSARQIKSCKVYGKIYSCELYRHGCQQSYDISSIYEPLFVFSKCACSKPKLANMLVANQSWQICLQQTKAGHYACSKPKLTNMLVANQSWHCNHYTIYATLSNNYIAIFNSVFFFRICFIFFCTHLDYKSCHCLKSPLFLQIRSKFVKI